MRNNLDKKRRVVVAATSQKNPRAVRAGGPVLAGLEFGHGRTIL